MKHLAPFLCCAATLALAALQPNLATTEAVAAKRPLLTEEYRKTVKDWGAGTFYAKRPEADVYQDVKKRDMHYLYTAFLEMFPRSAHRAEIEGLLQNFYLFDTPSRTTLSLDALKSRYNYDGDNGVFPWNNDFANSVVTDKANRVWRAPLCYGNLQFLSGGFIHRRTALEFLPGTQFIYRSKK